MMAAQHPDPDELIQHSIGTLDAAGCGPMRLHLAGCPECSERVAELRRDLALVAMSVPVAMPPAVARERLMQAVAADASSAAPTPAPGNASTASAPNLVPIRPRRSGSSLFWGGWLAAAVCLLFALHMRRENRAMHLELQAETAEILRMDASSARAQQVLDVLSSPHAQHVTLIAAHATPQPAGHAVYMWDRGALVFTASNLKPLPPNKGYELWMVPADGAAPMPAGMFWPDARGMASVLLPDLPTGVQAKTFCVTMENSAGSTTPTMPILLAGG